MAAATSHSSVLLPPPCPLPRCRCPWTPTLPACPSPSPCGSATWRLGTLRPVSTGREARPPCGERPMHPSFSRRRLRRLHGQLHPLPRPPLGGPAVLVDAAPGRRLQLDTPGLPRGPADAPDTGLIGASTSLPLNFVVVLCNCAVLNGVVWSEPKLECPSPTRVTLLSEYTLRIAGAGNQTNKHEFKREQINRR